MEQWWIHTNSRKQKYSKETLPHATFFTINPKGTGVGSNPGLCGEWLMADCLSNSTAAEQMGIKFVQHWEWFSVLFL